MAFIIYKIFVVFLKKVTTITTSKTKSFNGHNLAGSNRLKEMGGERI
jgi:hypothetical protein